jgi:hypothetical protein
MQTQATCRCGWQAQLSELYAGKRIRCPQCEALVEIPGASTTPLYNSPLPQHAHDGRWVPVKYASCTRGHCGGGGGFVLLVVLAISLMGLLRQCNREAQDPQATPAEETAPSTPEPKPREEKF